MRQYAHRITLKFKNPGIEQEPIHAQMKIAQVFDDFYLKSSELSIRYTRSKWQKNLDEAFNPTRYTRLKELWLIYYSIYGAFPVVASATFSSKGDTKKLTISELDLPSSTLSLDKRPFLTTNLAHSILVSEHRDSLLVSLSYLIASRQTSIDTMNRFRLLWSAFNPLYQIYTPSDKKVPESKKARNLMKKLDEREMLKEAQDIFSFAPKASSDESNSAWRFKKFIKNYMQANQNSAKFKHPAVVETIAEDSDKDTLSAMIRYQYLWKDIPDENNPIVRKLSSKESPEGSLFKFAMCDYLYWLRCDTMHGDSLYPIFTNPKQQDLLNILNDCLEIAVIQGIELCSKLH